MIVQKCESIRNLEFLYEKLNFFVESIVPMYDTIKQYIFNDISFHRIESFLPNWIMATGISPESTIDKSTYEQLRTIYNDCITNKIIYWCDVQLILVGIQDRISVIGSYLRNLYQIVPCYSIADSSKYICCNRLMNAETDLAHAYINITITSLATTFDLITKLVYEIYNFNKYDFSAYKKMISRRDGILYKPSIRIYAELKESGLFSNPSCVRKILTLRDDFIHNGVWDYRCTIYEAYICEDSPVDRFILAPDMTDNGLFTTSGSRSKFYHNEEKFNITFPYLVEDVINQLEWTMKKFKELLVENSQQNDKETIDANTDKYIQHLNDPEIQKQVLKIMKN